ncbi:MAG: NAD-dependent epimerase/dehydratase family protein [Acidimicrobiia bacterium]
MARRVAVTGAAGLIGGAVTARLAAAGDEVLGIDAKPSASHHRSVRWLTADVRDDAVLDGLAAFRPDEVIHAAAHPGGRSLAEPSTNVAVNAHGSMRLFEWCADHGSSVTFLSSSVVYGRGDGRPLSEDSPLAPGTVYGVGKVACEQWLRVLAEGRGLRWRVLRLFATYGAGHEPGLDQGIVNVMLTQLRRGTTVVVKGSPDRVRDMVYVDDVARMITLAIDTPAALGRILNVGTGVGVRIGDLIMEIADRLGHPQHEVTLDEQEGTVGDPQCNVADVGEMRRVLGDACRIDITEGLSRTIAALAG